MNQTSWIAAFVFIGFIVYVTIKGQLPAYQQAILNGKGVSSSGGIVPGAAPTPSAQTNAQTSSLS